MLPKTSVLFAVIIFIAISNINGQLSTLQQQQIDSLVAKWNVPHAPGGVVGIMREGKTVYTRAFGFASLDYDVPNSETTLFNIGSVSKQFTAIGIVKLQQQGRLSVDDDIRKYLPQLPDFGHVITIRHLLHHTSGLRDIHAILFLAGWGEDDPRSDDDLLRIMQQQHDLNFNPGNEYMYSNTGYIFMAKIIEKVTGERFEDWMKKNIFIPLGMPDTYIEHNASRVVRGNATSYNKLNDGGYARAVEYWNYIGSGNVHTSIKDILTWLNDFVYPPDEWKSAFEALQTCDPFNNGKMNRYAFGVSIGEYKGEKIIQHDGAVGAFRASAFVFPDKKICIAVLTNYASSQPTQKAQLLADVMMPELKNINSRPERTEPHYAAVPNHNLKKYEGDYWNNELNYARRIYIKNDTLWFSRGANAESPLLYIGNDEFVMLNTTNKMKVKFEFGAGYSKTMLVGTGESQNRLILYTPVQPTAQYLTEFTGTYNSEELKTYYTFSIRNDTLVGYHPKHGYFAVQVLKQDLFQADAPLGTVQFVRDSSKKIIGLRASYGRVKNFWLAKML